MLAHQPGNRVGRGGHGGPGHHAQAGTLDDRTLDVEVGPGVVGDEDGGVVHEGDEIKVRWQPRPSTSASITSPGAR